MTAANERASLPLRDGYSWLQRLHEWHTLREPLEFDQLVGYGENCTPWNMETRIYHHQNSKAHVRTYERGYYLALSDHESCHARREAFCQLYFDGIWIICTCWGNETY